MPEIGQEVLPQPKIEPKLSPELEARYLGERDRIKDLYGRVWMWHGAGRFDRPEGHDVVDVLAGIADAKELRPNRDVWNGSEEVETISATKNRAYATYYSDMHIQEGSDLEFKDKRATNIGRLTLIMHASPLYLPSLILNMRNVARQIGEGHKWIRRHTGRGAAEKDNHRDLTRFAGIRSEIPGDYPILLGLKYGTFEPMKTARYLKASEVRTDKPISVDNLTHMEVPLRNVSETKDLLRQKGVEIPIIPREFGERFSTEFSSWAVASNKWSK
ncbi:MAG TPA: hypothetical protein VHE53_03165 [Patescibacteria group bacterium]|nr:hypothetical protein [Patescibacteria group bacterium]